MKTTKSYELNQKEYNKVFLEMIINDLSEPDQNQRITLLDIASLCPYAEGEAVYQSRALLGDLTTAYDDVSICNSIPQGRAIKPETTDFDFKVYPNPSNGYAYVELENEADANGLITITNNLGQVLLTQKFDEGAKTVLVLGEDLPRGMFYLTVKIGTETKTMLFSNLK